MTTQAAASLRKMVEQIALNLGANRDPQQAAQKTADHLRRFWTPAMRAELCQQVRGAPEDFSAVARAVADALDS